MAQLASLDAAAPIAPSLAWLDDLCITVAGQMPELSSWDIDLWEGGVRVHLATPTQRIHLDLHARTEGRAFASTASLSMFLRVPEGQTLAAEADDVVKRFVALLDATDGGDIVLPKGGAIHVAPEVEDTGPSGHAGRLDTNVHTEALERYAEQLHSFSYIALKAILSDDLYPHVMSLGHDVPEAEIAASWTQVNTLMSQGEAPDKLGIYIHIPYCTVECSFCYCGKTEDFTRSDFDTYVDRLVDEMDVYGPLVQGQQITSVYFGGGTPSLLSPPAMRRIFERLYERFDVPPGTQVIFEGNPDSLKPAKVEILGTLGRVTRLTIGIQTLDPEVQKYVRRYNRKEDVESAIRSAREVGIGHVNFDCIAGLEGQSMASWQHDVLYLLSLEPDSIHLNGFRPLPRTIYGSRGSVLDPEQEALRDAMLAWGEQALADHGFKATLQQGPHRTRNAANIQEYDLRKQNSSLLGLGYPSRSHSFAGWYYIRDTSGGFVPALRDQNAGQRRYRGIRADIREEMHKYMVTNIRTGFVRREFSDLFGVDATDAFRASFDALEALGAVQYIDDRVLFRTGSAIDALVYRGFFYSEQLLDLAMAKWGKGYDRNADYRAELEYLVPKVD